MAYKNYFFKQSSDIGRLDGELHLCTHTAIRGTRQKLLSRIQVAAVIRTVELRIHQIVFALVVFATRSPLIGPVCLTGQVLVLNSYWKAVTAMMVRLVVH